jgi:glycosyltransferase involved in cell wall biosynthesis
VIPCGTALPDVDNLQTHDPRSRLQLAWIGRIVESDKRVSDLIRIAALLIDRGVAFHLTLVGDGPDADSVRALITHLGLENAVSMRGWQPSRVVQQTLAGSDILVLPSSREGMPIVVMEALAAGCAVAATRISGLEDFESHAMAQDILELFSVGDCENAADRIVALSAVPPAERRRNARAFAEAEFSVNRSVERYLALARRLPRGVGAEPRVDVGRELVSVASSHLLAVARYVRLRIANA